MRVILTSYIKLDKNSPLDFILTFKRVDYETLMKILKDCHTIHFLKGSDEKILDFLGIEDYIEVNEFVVRDTLILIKLFTDDLKRARILNEYVAYIIEVFEA